MNSPQAEQPLAESVIERFFEVLRHNGIPYAYELVQLAIGACLALGDVQGLCARGKKDGNAVPLVVELFTSAALNFTYTPHQVETIYHAAMALALDEFNYGIFLEKPNDKTAQATRRFWRYKNARFCPVGLPEMLISVQREVKRFQQYPNWRKDFNKYINAHFTGFSRYLKYIPKDTEVETVEDLIDALTAAINESSLRRQTKENYINLQLTALLSDRIRGPGRGRGRSGPRAASQKQSEAEEDTSPVSQSRDPKSLDYDELPSDHPNRRDFVKEVAVFEEEMNAEAAEAGARVGTKTGENPDVNQEQITLFTESTLSNMNVLRTPALAFLLQNIDLLPREDQQDRARMVLLMDLCYGMTFGLTNAKVKDTAPVNLTGHPGVIILRDKPLMHLRPKATVGRQKVYSPERLGDPRFSDAIAKLRWRFEPVAFAYFMPLYPAAAEAVQRWIERIGKRKTFLLKKEYKAALRDLSEILKKKHSLHKNITPGRLRVTSAAYLENYGVDFLRRFTISGKPRPEEEMPLNYTRISVDETCRMHWVALDKWFGSIEEEIPGANLGINLGEEIPEESRALIRDVHCGSSSVMQVGKLRKVIQTLTRQIEHPDTLPAHRFNCRLIRLGLLSGVILCFRWFEFERIVQLQNPHLEGDLLPFDVKDVTWDRDALQFKRLPTCIKNEFREVLAETNALQNQKAFRYLLTNGSLTTFRLQKGLNEICAAVLPDGHSLDVRGLRHLGRTLSYQFGMRQEFINFKMNHFGFRYQKFSPYTGPDLRGFPEEDEQVTRQIADFLGWRGA
jgi:hypothetical protein